MFGATLKATEPGCQADASGPGHLPQALPCDPQGGRDNGFHHPGEGRTEGRT